MLTGKGAERVEGFARHESERHREHRLGQRDQVDPRSLHQRPVFLEGAAQPFGGELGVLRNVGLHEPYLHRRAERLRPPLLSDEGSANKRDREHARGPDVATHAALAHRQRKNRKRAGQQRSDETDAVDAEDRREAGQRAIGMRVAARQPGKSGEERAAQPFRQRPGGGQRQRQAQERRTGYALRDAERQCRVERQEGAERGGRGTPPAARASGHRRAC